MKIAVTYDNGEIFQHFGHTEQFRFYEVKDEEIISSETVSTNGSGHGALAGFLAANSVKVVICGGIGEGAQNALASAGILLYAGISGSADEAVDNLIHGRLVSNPNASCGHHSHEGSHGCGGHCGHHE